MKTGTEISVLSQRIISDAAGKKDYTLDTRNLEMLPSSELMFRVKGKQHCVKPTRLCMEQIGSRVGIPAKYLERMRTEAPKLLADNVNHWLQYAPETRMLRTLNGGANVARAFLSQKYRPLDNYDLLNVVLLQIVEAGCEIKSMELTEHRLYIQAVTPKITGEIKVGDTVQAGIVISNSEVGCGSVRVEPLIYRLVCKNGMILPTAMRKHHVGRAGEGEWNEGDASEVFSDETRRLDDKAFWAKVNDVTKSALTQVKFAEQLKKLTDATKIDTGVPQEAVEIVGSLYGMQVTEKNSVLTHLAKGGDLSLWGLANAITRTAEDLPNYDRAIDFERFGGQAIELAPTLFN